MANSSDARKQTKPYAEFPLTPRGDNRWCKRIKGQLHYFAGDWKDALAEYERQAPYLHDGIEPPPKPDENALTLAGLLNHWLTHKRGLVDGGELSSRTFIDNHATAAILVEVLGDKRAAEDIGPQDFARVRDEMAKRWGPSRLGLQVLAVRSIFKFGFEMDLLSKPAKFGPAFIPPKEKVLRVEKQKRGSREFTPEQIEAMLKIASPNMKLATLLGINAGLGAADLGALPISAIDIETGILSFPRVKTATERRCPLWPETLAAVREVLAARVEPRNPRDTGLLFIRPRQRDRYVRSFSSEHAGGNLTQERTDALSQEFGRLCKKAGIVGRSHYDLRRTFQGRAEACGDLVAIAIIMGHTPQKNDMASRYRQQVDDSRLLAAVNAVRSWLYGDAKAKKEQSPRLRVVG